MGIVSDITLVTQVAVSGNKRAFDQLVVKYQSPVRRFFLHQTLGDAQLADDLAQDTFIKAYTNIARFRGLSSFQTWLMRIAYNVFYDYTRSRRSRQGAEEQLPAAAEMPRTTQQGALQMDLYTALAQLKEAERTCITLQLVDGYDIAQIARITQMPQGTVKSHLSRGKEKLTNYLKQNGYDR
ncbi:MAG: RNA polymerase sigma factor [Prevotella sp.]|nr:RNA polymerase sigma factor [Prevotella sp.]